MFQPDLFQSPGEMRVRRPKIERRGEGQKLGAPDVVARIAAISKRPKFTFLVLSLILKAADGKGTAGPYVSEEGGRVRIRDWLASAVFTMAQRDPKRLAIVNAVRADLDQRGELPLDSLAAERVIDDVVRDRLRNSGLSSISRAVSELVRADLVSRHYAGYRVDHANRGAQREAVYVVREDVGRALRGAP